MKKLLATFLSVLTLISLLSVMSLAGNVPFEEDYVSGNEIVLASFNGVQPFLKKLNNVEALEDACYWITDYAEAYNIKYVSFNGRMSSGSTDTYYSVVTVGKKTQDDLYKLNDTDKPWLKEFNALKSTGSILTDMEIPYGVSIGRDDYYSHGFDRRNHILNQFTSEDFTGGSPNIEVASYDSNTFAVFVEEGDQTYIIYQLEAFPRLAVMNWFKQMNEANLDKRAFVFTTSFLDKDGEMYTQYDASKYTYGTAPGGERGNSTMNTNMVWSGNPFDGTSIWNYALSQYDNIVMVMSANATVGKEIKTKTLTNVNGYETVAVVANLISGYGDNGGAYPVLIKFSEEEKTLDLRYAVPYDNMVGSYVEESQVTIKFKKLADLPDPDPVTLLPKAPAQVNGDNSAYINGYEGNVFKPNANMTKAEACAIFARLLAGSQDIPQGYTTKFTDVTADKWYYDEIAYLDAMGYFFTTEGDKYYPDNKITRAEFVELAYFASELAATENIKFTDVPEDHKYYDAIMAGAAAGLVNGYADKTFKPDATITRAEVVTVINRLLSLLATDETVSKDHLETIFTDIEGHWAEYQILIASNNDVHGEAFYKIDPSIFTETATSISFENKHIRVKLSKKNGKVEEVIYLPTGEDVFATSATPWFSYATSASGAILDPTKLELVDGRLKFTYKGGTVAYYIVEAFDNFFTVQLDSNLPKSLQGATFGYIDFDYTASETPGTFRASNVNMDTRVLHKATPGGYTSLVGGSTRTDLGVDTMGAKMAIAFSLMEEHREILKEVVLAIDPEKGITSTHGGPFTYDEECADLFEDYVIISSGLNLDTAVEIAETAHKYSFNQIDMHQGSIFTQGDFNFRSARTAEETENGTFVTAATFKERIADPMHEAGVQIGLHTYSSLVASSATSILSNPKWQQQLQYAETYTLRGDMSKFRTNIKTVEDASGFVGRGLPYSGEPMTSYVLIDEEIIYVSKGTTSGFINIRRGQFGTEAAKHEDGAEIRHLQGYYGMFQPQSGSELFWHIADNTAKAFNEGGFDNIYLDGLESFTRFNDTNVNYYYYAEFYRRVVSQCIKDPLIEDSAGTTVAWAARGRGGATDSATKGIKAHTTGQVNSAKGFAQRYYTATLGWFNFCPDAGQEYKNTIWKSMFRDDLDHMGSLAIAYNYSNVDNNFALSTYQANTSRQPDNVLYYSVYSKLRKGNYFSDEVKEQIKNGKYEYRVFEQADGTWAFREMQYVYNRVYDMFDKNYITGEATNPFPAQTPFVRIEQRYSTLGENEILVMELDETKEVSQLKGNNKSITQVDLSNHMALKVKVYGNGSETGGVMISITSPTASEKGRTDYYIPTSHTGWREFILIDADNADHPGANFSNLNYAWNIYETYRANPSRSQINAVSIGVAGDVAGVKIDDIKAYMAVDAPAKNPSVKIGSTTIT
ncbi:MAG: S-layer homology domain-containing protein, partial [Clostridia bacterium]|nr:S-layer homology domain-containing protein [Clostridia bacterium]